MPSVTKAANTSNIRDLGDRDLAFCDASSALDLAFENGLSRGVEIRTSSPGLFSLRQYHCRPLEAADQGDDTYSLGRETTALGDALHQAFRNDASLRRYALVAAQATLNFQRVVYKAQQLSERDIERRIVHVGIEAATPEQDLIFNGFWEDILSDHPDAVFLRYRVDPAAGSGHERNYGRFMDRWRLTGFPRVGYRLALRLWRHLPAGISRGSVLVLRENPLVRETAFHLAIKRYALRELPLPQTPLSSSPINFDLERIVLASLERYLSPRVPNWLLKTMIRQFLERLARDMKQYDTSVLFWKSILKDVSDKPAVVLTSMFNRPETVALTDACSEVGIELASAQHGVTTEISDPGDQIYWVEPVNSHVFLCYNREAERRGSTNHAGKAQCKAVGLPLEYHRLGGTGRSNSDMPILYASTTLYMGNVQQPSRPCLTDIEACNFEVGVIDRILGGLPHRVLYKTYPERRYLDPDPIFGSLRKHEHISVFSESLDLRFLVAKHRVIVTARATSTLAWCLMSRRPVVFLDIPGGHALDSQARRMMEDAVFVFSAGEPGWHENARAFLSQPIKDIESAYRAKQTAREAAIEQLFGTGGPGAGARAAAYLENRMTA